MADRGEENLQRDIAVIASSNETFQKGLGQNDSDCLTLAHLD